MLEILGAVFGIVIIIAFLVSIVISAVAAVTIFRQFNDIGGSHQEVTDEFDKAWKGF